MRTKRLRSANRQIAASTTSPFPLPTVLPSICGCAKLPCFLSHGNISLKPERWTRRRLKETVAGAPISSQLPHLNAVRRLRDERVRAGLLAFDVIIAGWGLLWVFASRLKWKIAFFPPSAAVTCPTRTRGSSHRSSTSLRVCKATWHTEHLFPAPSNFIYFFYFMCFSVWFLRHLSLLCSWS